MLFTFIQVDVGDGDYVEKFQQIDAAEAVALYRYLNNTKLDADERQRLYGLLPYHEYATKEDMVAEQMIQEIKIVGGELVLDAYQYLGKWHNRGV